MSTPWDADFVTRSPLFAPLQTVARGLRTAAWPDCAALNALGAALPRPLVNADGRRLSFVPQSSLRTAFEDKYEPRIFLRGEVQMRGENWHDLFNALVWMTFPRAKAAINRRHHEALCVRQAAGLPNRGAHQDALTLFDEGGVIVASADSVLSELLRGHEWKMLFWHRRAGLAGSMGFYLFGHAIYEKALRPFAGMTGRGVILEVDNSFFALAPGVQLEELDARLAQLLEDPLNFRTAREQSPVPVLGVPGWCADNADAAYYDNTGYFRPPRRVSATGRRRP